MKKFLLSFILFLLPFAVAVTVEVCVLPVDFFTYRVWEALEVLSLQESLPGHWYPRMKISKVEEGDLAHHTRCALKKTSYWETDRYGYRKKDNPLSVPRIVIIGDSNTVGSALTQRELLSEVLETMVKVPVYPLAPATINTFFREVRFADNPPSIVVVAAIERNIIWLPELETKLLDVPEYKKVLLRMKTALQTSSFIQSFMVPIARARQSNLLYYSRASLRRILEPHPGTALPCEKMFFLQGEKANQEMSAGDFQRVVAAIRSYHDGLRKKGIRFIFLPIPNKETIYYDLLPAGKRPVFIPKLVSALEALGIETIDSQLLFEEARRRKGALLYHRDDTHWNAEGVRLSAEALASHIRMEHGKLQIGLCPATRMAE